MSKELEIGKRYTWEEVKEAYPGKWVRMKECRLGWGKSIIDGVLAGVYNDGETREVRREVRKRNDETDQLCRTEYGMGLGWIDCLNAEMEVKDEP